MLRTLGGGGTGVDLSIAELGLQLGRYPAAAAAANRLLITHPVDARTVLARVALAEGRAENAAQLARRALSDDDNALAAHLILAEALVSIGELQQALDHAGRAAVDPTLRAPALVLSGRVLMVGGNPEAARQALDQALNADPTFLSAHIFMAATYFATGGVDPGLAALQEMVRINPTVAAERRAIETLDRFGLSAAADEWRASAQARHPDAAAELGRR
jgi:tetratricopeptide (TPR) repeat protein